MKVLVIITIALGIILAGCNFSYDSEKEIDIEKKTYRTLVELADGVFILPSSFVGGSAQSVLIDMFENRDYHLIIENFGGSAFDLISIINRIEELQSMGFTITTETYGYALSAGGILFLMGDVRIMHSGAILMYHGGGFSGFGGRTSLKNPDGLKKHTVKMLKLMDGIMIQLMKDKTLMSDEEIQAWMYGEDENFMSSKEAKKLEVATEVK